MGYLGGVIVLVGVGYLVSVSWEEISASAQLALAAGATVALIVAGGAIPAARLGPTGTRLRGVLWALGTVGVFGSLITLFGNVVHWDADRSAVIAVIGGTTGLLAAGLWALNRHVLQHLSAVWPTMIAANMGAALATHDWFLASLAVWLVGVVWFLLSLRDIIPSRSGGVVGALGATFGALMMLGEQPGPVTALGTVVTLVGTAVARRNVALLGIGSIGTLVVLPFFVNRYFPGEPLVTAAVLVTSGLALVIVGIVTVRRRRDETAPAT
jgi:hypothetical protein